MAARLCLTWMLLLAAMANAQVAVFDVSSYGARAGGDVTNALSNAWKAACASTSSSRVIIPKGSYNLGIITLAGPCKAPIDLHVAGTVVSPAEISGDSWITINSVDRLTISGYGVLNGQGQQAWKTNDCGKNSNCNLKAINLRLNFVTNGLVRDITSANSKTFHVNLLGCRNLTFQNFAARAPKTSINTDGIHIGRSYGINITDSILATGDDCISIGDDSQQIRITRVRCGPGHGISIGSLGKYKNEKPVSGVYVTDSVITGADNGLRIKSWPAKEGGLATDMHFQNIRMENVSNPILIDQMYCPWNQCNNRLPSRVQISNVSFKNITGTSFTPVAVQLSCSSGTPCKNVVLADIDLKYSGPAGFGPEKSVCTNVKPTISGKIIPTGC